MGKGGGELEGFMQLAGGMLVGGFALYKMTQDDRELGLREQQQTTTTAGAAAATAIPAPVKRAPSQQQMKHTLTAVPPPAPQQTHAHAQTQHDDDGDDDLPSWMSRKAPETDSAEASLFGQPLAAPKQQQKPQQPQQQKQQQQHMYQPATYDQLSYASSATDASDDSDALPSWMSTKDPQLRLAELQDAPVKKQQQQQHVQQHTPQHVPQQQQQQPAVATTVNRAVSAAAAALSDVVFVYPGGAAAHLGAGLLSAGGRGARVQVMDTRGGAGAAVVGAASGGARVAVLAGSASLPDMLPALLELAAQRLPAVVHVAAAGVGARDLALRQDLSGVLAVRGCGAALLLSGSAQEAADMAPLAHALAAQTSAPVLHAFDGARALEQLTALRPPRLAAAAALGQDMIQQAPAALSGLEAAARGTDCPHAAAAADRLLRGAGYRAFEYAGAAEPDVVVVAAGAVAAVLRAELGSGGGGARAGVLTVRLARPWAALLLLQALPRSARRVAVLEPALFADVAAALHSDAWRALRGADARAPLLLSGRVGPLASGFSPAMARAVLANARAERPVAAFALADAQAPLPAGEQPLPQLPVDGDAGLDVLGTPAQEAQQQQRRQRAVVAFASSGAAGARLRLAGEAVATQLCATGASGGKLTAQLTLAEDPYAGARGLVRAELRVGAGPLPESYAVSAADVVLLEQGAAAHCGGAAAALLREGGALLLLPSAGASADDAVAALPRAARAELSRKSAQLAVLDAHALLQRAVEASGQEAAPAALAAAAQWMALVGALRLSEGSAGFGSSGVASALQKALHASAAPEIGSALAAALVASTPLVDGYLAHRTRALQTDAASLGGPHAYAVTSHASVHAGSSSASSFADTGELDAHSFASARSFGGAASPIAFASPTRSHSHSTAVHVNGSAASSSMFVPRLRLQAPELADAGSRHAATLGRSLHEPDEARNKSAAHEVVRLSKHHVALSALFPHKYARETAVKPAEREQVYQVRLTKNERLTPGDYNRNIFHLEFDISDTDMTYQIGDALGVYAQNDEAEVDAFIRDYGLDPDAFVAIPARGRMAAGRTEIVSTRNLLLAHLDLWGKPSKRFYCQLAAFAQSHYESLKLLHTGTDDTEQFKLGVYETVTFADLLLQYRSARLTIEDLVQIVPAIKARHYSIASSQALNPTSVHLLVVAVDWETPRGRKRFGQCTRYLAGLDPTRGKPVYVAVDVISSVLRLPESPKAAIIMIGLGTGMAPFRAFVQQRKHQREQGIEVGPIYLYFGARHRHEEWLYGPEWDAYEREGLVTRLGLAFSRDQKDKIYIQHRMEEDKLALRQLFERHDAHAFLCGPVWPVPDVSAALAKALSPEKFAQGVLDLEAVDALKKAGRFVLEVY